MTFPGSGPDHQAQGGAQHQQQPQAPSSGGFAQSYQQQPHQQQPYQQQTYQQQPQAYQQQPYQQQARRPGVNPAATQNAGVFLALGVTLLALVQYFVSFSDEVGTGGTLQFVLIGGLLAALRVLPKAPKVLPFATLASVLGALYMILTAVRVSSVSGVLIVLLILSILQALVAVVALLVDYELVTLPTGSQRYSYGQPYAQQGPHSQQAGAGQFPQQSHQQTQYGPPVTPSNQPSNQPSQSAAPQPTQYASQQGHFHPPQTQASGEQDRPGSQ